MSALPVSKANRDQDAAFAQAQRAALGSIEPLPGFVASEVWNGYTPAAYVLKHALEPGEPSVLFGQSGHFKSAIAIDMACCAGSGTPFHGIKTRKVGVLYTAGEGHSGIRKRLRAWMIARGMDATSEQPAVYITKAGADLIGNPEQLRLTVDAAADALELPIGLVVIDTLAANFGAGDENHARDMSLAVTNARSAAPEAAILLVHHTGHGAQDRERGSTALIGAATYRLQATYDEQSRLIELQWLKAKDDERPVAIVFGWQKVPLGWEDDDGEELTSIILERLEGATFNRAPQPIGLGKNQDTAIKCLRVLYARARRNLAQQGRDPGDALILTTGWRTACQDKGIKRNRWAEVLRDLQDRKLISIEGPHVTIMETAE